MTRMDRIANGLLRPINPYAMLILGAFTTAWGLWVLSPWWDVFTTAPLFMRMQQLAPEWAWGLVATVAGTVTIWSIFKGRNWFLSAALVLTAWVWSVVAAMLWWGDWHNTGGVTYSFAAIYSIYAYLNIKCNYVKKHGHQAFF